MKLQFDLSTGDVQLLDGNESRTLDPTSPETFRLASKAWIRATWESKYIYSFSWLGRPVIQLPDDLLRLQELVFSQKPDVVLETGIAHGGSLIFHASLLKAMGRGHVIGVDVEIRPHNRTAIEAHPLYQEGWITMIEGSSVAGETFASVKEAIGDAENVLVILDSNHSKAHVYEELELYAPLIPVGGTIVACDGVMAEVVGGSRTQEDWTWNNPTEAAREFVDKHPDFELAYPQIPFNEGTAEDFVTYFPEGYIRRLA